MLPTRIFDIFKDMMPEKAKDIASFKRIDDHSIEMVTKDKKKFIFSVPSKGWELKEMKGKGAKK